MPRNIMNKPDKITIQKYYFSLFAKAYNQLPVGEISYTDKPDIIIKGDNVIGIEMTNFYLQDGSIRESEQQQRYLRELVLSRAHQKYLSGGGKKIDIHFGFKSPINKINILIQKIVELAKKIDNKSGEILKATYQDIPELDYVYVNPKEYDNPKWLPCQVYTGQIMSKENLVNKIREKEKLTKDYQKCDEYWLLLIIDFIDRAQDQEIIERITDIISSVFKKIIIYKTAFDKIVSNI